MGEIEELPDDMNEQLNLNQLGTPNTQSPDAFLSALISQAVPFPPKAGAPQPQQHGDVAQPTAAMPPAMAAVKQYDADELATMLNRTPLFMTTLDETDGEGGENLELEAIKALAYEGTRAEVAENFREQGNELARVKHWSDAKQFYDKAIAALKGPQRPVHTEDGPADIEAVEVDVAEEGRKERNIAEACYVNRALCNLEKKNYRSCNFDCAAALKLNASNIKAWYRSASACLALDKIPEAEDACARALEIDCNNTALQTLSTKVQKRKDYLAAQEKQRRDWVERVTSEERTLKLALKARNIPTRTTEQAPEMEDATLKLEKPLDASSTLSIPTVLLYSVDLQSDFVKAFQETEMLEQHLSYIFPLPWDKKAEYTVAGVECYIETVAGGLIKAGKRLALYKILTTGKVELVDSLLKIHVLPKNKAPAWIEEFKKKRRFP